MFRRTLRKKVVISPVMLIFALNRRLATPVGLFANGLPRSAKAALGRVRYGLAFSTASGFQAYLQMLAASSG